MENLVHFEFVVTLPLALDHFDFASFWIRKDFAIVRLVIVALELLSSSFLSILTLGLLVVVCLMFIFVFEVELVELHLL